MEEIKKCLQCGQELSGKQAKYCSQACKKKYKYHNDETYRLEKIKSAQERVEEQREIEKARRKSLQFKDLLDQIDKVDNEEDKAIQALFDKIMKK